MSVNDDSPKTARKLRSDAVVSAGDMSQSMDKETFRSIARLSPMSDDMKNGAYAVLVFGEPLTSVAARLEVTPSVLWRACRAIRKKAPDAPGGGGAIYQAFEVWYAERIERVPVFVDGPDGRRHWPNKTWPALVLRADLDEYTSTSGRRLTCAQFGRLMFSKGHFPILRHGRSAYNDVCVLAGPLADERVAHERLTKFDREKDPMIAMRAKREAASTERRAAKIAMKAEKEAQRKALRRITWDKDEDALEKVFIYPTRQPNGAPWMDMRTGQPIPDSEVQGYFESLERFRSGG